MAQELKLDLTFLKDWQTSALKKIAKVRYSLLIIHRRGGKSVLSIAYLIYKALRVSGKDLGYLGPYLNQTKSIAWEYMKKFATQIPGAEINNSELKIRFSNGSTIRLFGGDNPDSLRGLNLSTIIIDEFDDINPELFGQIIFPQINFHGEDGQAIFLGTPKGKKHIYKLWNKTKDDSRRFNLRLNVEQSGVLAENLIEEAREQISPSQFAQEYMCSFEAAVRGSYYQEYIDTLILEDRLISSAYNPDLPVTVHMDIGISDATSLVYTQYDGSRVYWIDYDEFNGKGFPYYMEVFRSKPYNYDTFYLPHDGKVMEYTGMTRIETFRKLSDGLGAVDIVPRQKIEDGINAVRDVLPNLYVDDSLEIQLDRLGMYEAAFDEKKQIFTKPIHNEYSHIADAIRYMATTYKTKTQTYEWMPAFVTDYDDFL